MAISPDQPSGPESSGRSIKGAPSHLLARASGSAPEIPDYELLRRIGHGAYGEVWLARNVIGSYVAVKVVTRGAFDHDRPFEREFEGIKRFEPISRSDPSQVAILHVGRGEGFFYYVMELADAVENSEAEGRRCRPIPDAKSETAPNGKMWTSDFPLPSQFDVRTLESYVPHTLRADLKRHGRLPVSQCVTIGLGLTRALAHLHRCGLVHRDVKSRPRIFGATALKRAKTTTFSEKSNRVPGDKCKADSNPRYRFHR